MLEEIFAVSLWPQLNLSSMYMSSNFFKQNLQEILINVI